MKYSFKLTLTKATAALTLVYRVTKRAPNIAAFEDIIYRKERGEVGYTVG